MKLWKDAQKRLGVTEQVSVDDEIQEDRYYYASKPMKWKKDGIKEGGWANEFSVSYL